jgi:Domain of unknown function (DUF4926)
MKIGPIHEYDLVRLREPFQDVPAGTAGTVLIVYDDGKAVEVEFSSYESPSITYTIPIDLVAHLEKPD